MRPDSPPAQSAWVQLYQARRVPVEAQTRPPGRPPALVPRHKVGVTLSQGEISELENWQNRFSELMERKVSLGETIGILVRVCSTLYTNLQGELPEDLNDLVARLVGNE
ncbi:MAG: hypothetical protein ABFD29_06155 [Anaerolineaceae bacterium]